MEDLDNEALEYNRWLEGEEAVEEEEYPSSSDNDKDVAPRDGSSDSGSSYHPDETSMPSEEFEGTVTPEEEDELLSSAGRRTVRSASPVREGDPSADMEIDQLMEDVELGGDEGPVAEEEEAGRDEEEIPAPKPKKKRAVRVEERGEIRLPRVRLPIPTPMRFSEIHLRFIQTICEFCEKRDKECNAPTDGSACEPCRLNKTACSLSDSKRGRRG